MKLDYAHYHFRKLEILRYLSESIGIVILINYLCYKNIFAFLPLSVIPPLYLKHKKKQLTEKRKKRLNHTFRDAMNSLSVALKAGYSMENAITECVKDLQKLYAEDEPILLEFHYIKNQLRISVPVETLLADLGRRSGVEDIQSFANIYSIARRSGGNVSRILQNTAKNIGDRIEVEQEVAACVAAKKTEQMIMAAVPCGIILYMQLASPGFLDILYQNTLGIIIMTACLTAYGGAFWMGRKIVSIEV